MCLNQRNSNYWEYTVSEVNHQDRTFWPMIGLSVAAHALIGIAVGRAALQVEFEAPQRGLTSVSVQLIAAPAEQPIVDSTPLEPRPQEVPDVRPVVPEPTMEPVLTRVEPTPDSTPYVAVIEPRKATEEPQVEVAQHAPETRRRTRTPTVTPRADVVPNADRHLVSAASSGAESVSVEFRTRVNPSYPRELWLKRVTGDVELLATVGPDGSVVRASVFKTSGHAAFDESALAAVRQWRAQPLTRNSAGTQDVIVPISFRIRG